MVNSERRSVISAQSDVMHYLPGRHLDVLYRFMEDSRNDQVLADVSWQTRNLSLGGSSGSGEHPPSHGRDGLLSHPHRERPNLKRCNGSRLNNNREQLPNFLGAESCVPETSSSHNDKSKELTLKQGADLVNRRRPRSNGSAKMLRRNGSNIVSNGKSSAADSNNSASLIAQSFQGHGTRMRRSRGASKNLVQARINRFKHMYGLAVSPDDAGKGEGEGSDDASMRLIQSCAGDKDVVL